MHLEVLKYYHRQSQLKKAQKGFFSFLQRSEKKSLTTPDFAAAVPAAAVKKEKKKKEIKAVPRNWKLGIKL